MTCAASPKEKHSDGEEEEEKKKKSGKEQKAVKKEDGSTGKKPRLCLNWNDVILVILKSRNDQQKLSNQIDDKQVPGCFIVSDVKLNEPL